MAVILPSINVVKPQNMSRRGFLRFLGITTTIATVPSLIIPEKSSFSEICNKYFGPYPVKITEIEYFSATDKQRQNFKITDYDMLNRTITGYYKCQI